MDIYAVLTGDIVRSRHIDSKDKLMNALTEVLDTVKKEHHVEYDLYRGDSFQIVVPSASTAALVAIIIRSKLISCSPKKQERWDARISIGLGTISYRGSKITDSDGPAFLLSGQGLDQINKQNRRLIIKTPWTTTDKMISLNTRFVDDIISRWSKYSAETAYYSLLYNESQSVLAARLEKSQPTINHRIATAKLDLIKAYILHVKEHIQCETHNECL
jgi:hypothetical protein